VGQSPERVTCPKPKKLLPPVRLTRARIAAPVVVVLIRAFGLAEDASESVQFGAERFLAVLVVAVGSRAYENAVSAFRAVRLLEIGGARVEMAARELVGGVVGTRHT